MYDLKLLLNLDKEVGEFGEWSTYGCYKDGNNSTDEIVTCKCNHLTNFACLMDVSQSITEEASLPLQIVTWIGCVLSIVGLLWTFIVHLKLK